MKSIFSYIYKLFVEVNVCLYLRTCIFGLTMFIMINLKNDVYFSKSESAQRNQEPKWTKHQTWRERIEQAALANGKRHQRSYARIRRGMCASGKWRWPMPCSISQGLEASVVSCVHWLGVTDRGLRTSANSKQHRPTVGDIGQGMHALNVACAHLVNDICQRPACISRAMHASTARHHPWPARISQRQETSPKACTHQLWCVHIDWRQRPWPARIG